MLGGSLGGQKAVVIRDDDQLKPDVGAQIVQKFIEKDKVDVIVGLGFSLTYTDTNISGETCEATYGDSDYCDSNVTLAVSKSF